MQSAGDTAVNLGKIARFEASLPLLNNWLKDALWTEMWEIPDCQQSAFSIARQAEANRAVLPAG